MTFTQQNALGNANFFNVGFVGFLFSGDPAVLSSQGETMGVANILITFPNFTSIFSIDYGTFLGSPVTFAFSNGFNGMFASTGSGYATVDFLGVSSRPHSTGCRSLQLTWY